MTKIYTRDLSRDISRLAKFLDAEYQRIAIINDINGGDHDETVSRLYHEVKRLEECANILWEMKASFCYGDGK